MTTNTSFSPSRRYYRRAGSQSPATSCGDGSNSLLCLFSRPSRARRRCHDFGGNSHGTSNDCRQRSSISRFLWQWFTIWMLLSRGVSCADSIMYDKATDLMGLPRDILFDTSEPPVPMALLARQESSSSIPTTTSAAGTASSSAASQTSSASFTLPTPFDHSLGNNFTSSSCPNFFNVFLNDPDFENCRPFSLLLGTSQGFFQAQRSLIALSRTLDATCNVDVDQCEAIMAKYAHEITQTNNCGTDYQMQNPSVMQAYNGFIAYRPLYTAGCLKNANGEYCFAAAATNASAYQNNYIYYLPLGTQIPGGAQPACTQCLRDTMGIFAQAAGNSTQPLHMDYNGAAQQLDMNCGPSFAQTVAHSSAAAPRVPSWSSPPSGLLALLSLFALAWGMI